jgi:hypothetical protein
VTVAPRRTGPVPVHHRTAGAGDPSLPTVGLPHRPDGAREIGRPIRDVLGRVVPAAAG